MVSNIFLNYCLNNLDNFIGTFSCDNIPPISKQQNLLIINLSKSDEIGTHFIALNILKYSNSLKCKVQYMDPLGGYCKNMYIINYLKHYCKSYLYLEHPIQNILSQKCGFFCLAFVLECIGQKGSIVSFANKFNIRNLLHNDIILEKYILKVI